MELYEREFFVSRIDAGYLLYKHGNLTLKIRPPNKDVAYMSSIVYQNAYDKALLMDIMTLDEAFGILKQSGLWTATMESDFEKLPTHMEDLKVGLYEAAYKSLEQKKIRGYLSISREEYKRLYGIRFCWEKYTAEGMAAFAKWSYCISESTTYLDDTKYRWDGDITVVDVMNFIRANHIEDGKIRELARTDPWTIMWAYRKSSRVPVFAEPMTHEQIALVMWSKTYESVHESPECPSEDVLADDDMFDGWLILRSRKNKKEKASSGFSQFTKNKKIANSDEVYIQADTIDDAKKIHQMNDPVAARKKARRFSQLDKQGEVQLQHFGDIQQQLKMDAAQALVNRVKGGG